MYYFNHFRFDVFHMNMSGIKNHKIRRGVRRKDHRILISRLYKNYPNVAKAKISEYEKTFSPGNPFFTYGNAEDYFLFHNGKAVGHIAAIADDRFGDIGSVGFFECENEQKYADMLFENSATFLKHAGKKQCRGPINVSVWQNSRVSYPEKNPPFCLEPFTPEYYRDLFLGNGFIVGHQNITTTESIDRTRIKSYEDLYIQSLHEGYSFEMLTKTNAKESMQAVYSLTNEIFEGSYSFYRISEEEFSFFAGHYAKMQNPHYIFIIKDPHQKPAGFSFAISDIFNPHLKNVVIKTIGLLPEYRGLGLGGALLYVIYNNAKKDGFKELIFSTISVDNERIKLLTGQDLLPYRIYEVYEKNII